MGSKRGTSGAKVIAELPPGELDERVRRSRSTILGATVELLLERGFGDTSVDEVSRRSGVAKTTIYRHWPTRADLLRDACATLGTPLDIPDEGSSEADVTSLLMSLARMLRSARWTSVLPSVIDAAERDPAIARMYARLQEGYSAPARFVIQRAIARGELPGDTEIEVLVAMLIGPLFYRRWFSREPLTPSFVRQVVGRVLGSQRSAAAPESERPVPARERP